MREYLADLDELVLLCRDDRARQYINEAVACYRAGAFRSCIVATWSAVVYDFIHKLQELELSGDKNAKIRLEEFEALRRQADISGSLQFERNVVEQLHQFELLSPLEYADLKRLLEDRNRCAHPSMNSLEEPYQPTAELARYHLRNTVTSLLQHPPVQGKAALARLQRDVDSPYFPRAIEDAVKHFRQGPLLRPREALVRNFVVILAKTLLLDVADEARDRRYATALNAVRLLHHDITEKTLREKLSDIVRNVSDSELLKVVGVLSAISDTCQFMQPDQLGRIEMYVENMPSRDVMPGLAFSLEIGELQSKAVRRLQRVDFDELSVLVIFYPKPAYVNPAIQMYAGANSFAEANSIGARIIIPLAKYFRPSDIEKIIQAAAQNNQITYSKMLKSVIKNLREAMIISDQALDEMLRQYNLEAIIAQVEA
jgi:hypothetical protein